MINLTVDPRCVIRGYSTPAQAIEAAKRGFLFREKLANTLLVERISYSETAFVVDLSERRSFVITLMPGPHLQCKLDDQVETTLCASLPSVISLSYHGGYHKIWDRDEIPSLMKQRALSRVFYNPPALFVYIKGIQTIMFAPLHIVGTKRHLLHWEQVS